MVTWDKVEYFESPVFIKSWWFRRDPIWKVWCSESVFPVPFVRLFVELISSRLVYPMAAHLSSKEDYESLLDKYDTWMFDCDGVLWHGDRPIDGAVEVLDILRKRGKHNWHTFSQIIHRVS